MLTWNVDWLRNGRRTGKDWEYFVSDCSGEVYTQIINIVKEYLDMNAYDGCNVKLTEDRYKQILNITEDVVSEDEITYKGDTLIDHILIKNITNNEKAIVQKDFNLSDHKYVTFCLNV
ncbi:hypothetical protein [uncultured Clostridium sp.]|uniref:hypothetical protein n=1 Tax=uncultured Clostridium sp. TaxID=59620 RepID=UPI00258ACE7D|nr:hypothetical protein [uncultured Clostridium sp.]